MKDRRHIPKPDFSPTPEHAEYFCPHCDAVLNNQAGFNPIRGFWQCAVCDTLLYGDAAEKDARYPGVFWYCDECSAFLNEQVGFTDDQNIWRCSICGHPNVIDETAVFPGQSNDYATFPHHSALFAKRRNLPPILGKRQVELLQSVVADVQLDNNDPNYWENIACEIEDLLRAGGTNENGEANSVGIICQSILFLLR